MLHFPSPFSRLRVDQLLEPVDYVWSMTTHIPRGMVIGPPRGEEGEESIFFFFAWNCSRLSVRAKIRDSFIVYRERRNRTVQIKSKAYKIIIHNKVPKISNIEGRI